MPFFQILTFVVAQKPQTPTPTPTPTITPVPSPNMELLMQQIKFLQDSNTQLTASFNSFVSALSLSFVVIALILGLLSAVGAFFYGKAINDVKQSVGSVVRQEVEKVVSVTIKNRVDYLEQVLQREEVIGWVSIDYLLPVEQRITAPPREYEFLKVRGFREVNLRDRIDKVNYQNHLLVLDLVNHQVTEDKAALIIKEISEKLSPNSVLVIYLIGRYIAIDELLKNKKIYSVAANSPITLMGTVVNSAYLADALRR